MILVLLARYKIFGGERTVSARKASCNAAHASRSGRKRGG